MGVHSHLDLIGGPRSPAASLYDWLNIGQAFSSNATLFMNGTLGTDTESYYWMLSLEYSLLAPARICYESPSLVASLSSGANVSDTLVNEFFIDAGLVESLDSELPDTCDGGPKLTQTECTSLCTKLGADTLGSCPLNLLGCCECHYFQSKVSNVHESTFYGDFSHMILSGPFNLSIWVSLLVMLVLLVMSKQNRSTAKERNSFVGHARSILANSMRTVALTGMALYIGWVVVYLLGFNDLSYLGYYSFTSTGVGIFLHVFAGVIWQACAMFQYIGPIRRRLPFLHRAAGWTFIVSEALSSVGLLVVLLGPHGSGIGGTISGIMFLGYWNVTLFLGTKFAIKRDIESHRRWFARNVFTGSAVILAQLWSYIDMSLFKGPSYYLGNVYHGLCSEQTGANGLTIQTLQAGDESTVRFSPEQIAFACNGIVALRDQLSSNVEFFFVFTFVGIFICETWLWTTNQQYYQTVRSNMSIEPFVGAASNRQSAVNLLREADELEIKLVEKSYLADDAYLMRFEMPNQSILGPDSLLVPLLGHVNLRSIKTGILHRPRAFSPLYALERGHMTFIVRDAKQNGLSSYMTQEMKLGDKMMLSGPFALPAMDYTLGKRVLILAAGTGLAPFLTLVRSIQANNESPQGARCKVLYRDKKGRALDAQTLLKCASQRDNDQASSCSANLSSYLSENSHSKTKQIEYSSDENPADSRPSTVINIEPHAIHNHSTSTYSSSSSVDVETLLEREQYNAALDKALNSEFEDPWTSILICGPPAFNFATRQEVSRRVGPQAHIVCVGTDDR